jgi:hypothetical protein
MQKDDTRKNYAVLKKIENLHLSDAEISEFSNYMDLIINVIQSGSNVDQVILDTFKCLICTTLSDDQKNMFLYDIFESLLKEISASEITIQKLISDNKVSEYNVASNEMTGKQQQLYCRIRDYKKNLKKIAKPLSMYLKNYFLQFSWSENYRDQIEMHYTKFAQWDADIRSNIIRSLQKKCRGFSFKKI